MNIIRNIGDRIGGEELQERVLQTAGITCMSSICAYGGTFFFTAYKPLDGVFYLGIVALTSYVAYQALETMKEWVESDRLKYVITSIQLFQIPILLYVLPGSLNQQLTGAAKLEILIATAHFVAVPVFFHLGLEAWKDPCFEKVAPVIAMMLTLSQGLRHYVRV